MGVFRKIGILVCCKNELVLRTKIPGFDWEFFRFVWMRLFFSYGNSCEELFDYLFSDLGVVLGIRWVAWFPFLLCDSWFGYQFICKVPYNPP